MWKGKPEKGLLGHINLDALVEIILEGLPSDTGVEVTNKDIGFIDFKRTMDGIPALVSRIEYDPNRTAHIALLVYENGSKSYIVAPKGLEIGALLKSGPDASIQTGNCLPLKNIPVGSIVHCVEMKPGKDANW